MDRVKEQASVIKLKTIEFTRNQYLMAQNRASAMKQNVVDFGKKSVAYGKKSVKKIREKVD